MTDAELAFAPALPPDPDVNDDNPAALLRLGNALAGVSRKKDTFPGAAHAVQAASGLRISRAGETFSTTDPPTDQPLRRVIRRYNPATDPSQSCQRHP